MELKAESSLESIQTDSSSQGGRPALEILDTLTVPLARTIPGKPRTYRCAGKGCPKKWSPRSRIRVLQHCKRCLFMTSEQRQLSAKASAASSPGALVEAALAENSSPTPNLSEQCDDDKSTHEKQLTRGEIFFGPGGRRQLHQCLDLAIIKFFCSARLPPAIVDSKEWKELFKLQTSSYQPASSTRLMEDHIMSEQERVRQLDIAYLRTQRRITISFDGGDTRASDAFYTVHATAQDNQHVRGRRVILLEGQECTTVSHTGEWIAEFVLRVGDFFFFNS